jgi:hypothetical protein
MSFDAFLQCSVEERDLLVELATGFYNLGYRVWLDDDLTSSKIGVTLLSPSFVGTNAHDRLRAWMHAESIQGDAFEAALLAASASPVAQHLLPFWRRLKGAEVHCFSRLSFDEPDEGARTPRLTRADSARLRKRIPVHAVAPTPPNDVTMDMYIPPSVHSPLAVLQTVGLKRPLPEHGLERNDVGVVAALSMPDLADVEFGLVAGKPRVRATVHFEDIKAVELCGGCWKVLGEADYEYGPGPYCFRQCSTCGHVDMSSVEGLLTL